MPGRTLTFFSLAVDRYTLLRKLLPPFRSIQTVSDADGRLPKTAGCHGAVKSLSPFTASLRVTSLQLFVKKAGHPKHPSVGGELRALRRLQREQEPKSPFVFTSERGAPFTTAGFARMIERAGTEAKFGFKPHPHMLRHACGYALANRGHDTRALQAYLGHKNISTLCDILSYHRLDSKTFGGNEQSDLTTGDLINEANRRTRDRNTS
jgi:hypothetical protein